MHNAETAAESAMQEAAALLRAEKTLAAAARAAGCSEDEVNALRAAMREAEAEADGLKQELHHAGEELLAYRGDVEDLCIMQEAASRSMAKAQVASRLLLSTSSPGVPIVGS